LPEEPGFGWEKHYESKVIDYPCFNPNNDNEFLFVNYLGPNSQVYTYNLETKALKLIFDGLVWYPPKWSPKKLDIVECRATDLESKIRWR
jgi:hypothetical protein